MGLTKPVGVTTLVSSAMVAPTGAVFTTTLSAGHMPVKGRREGVEADDLLGP